MVAAHLPDTICHAPDRDALLRMDALLPYIPRSASRILDCTGAPAQHGTLLKAHGAQNVIGLLDSSAGIPHGDSGYDDCIQGPLDFVTLPPTDPPFDCIVCTAALERLRNPDAFLPRLLERLAPGGYFLATVPNMQYHKIVCALAQGRWVYGDSGVWDRKNLRFYTARELKQLLLLAGMRDCKIASLVKDSETEFPRDADTYARSGPLRIGPLDDASYQAWLAEYYLAVAVKS